MDVDTRLFEASAGTVGVVSIDRAFDPLPEYEMLAAAGAFVSRERWKIADPAIYLAGGGRELCLLNKKPEQIKVTISDKVTTTYSQPQEIRLTLSGGSLEV